MKLMGLTVPLLIVSLTAATVCGLGTLAVRAGAASTRTSIDLLRMQLRVTRLHEQLVQQSRDRLAAQTQAILPGVTKGPAPSEERLARPWPEGTRTLSSRRAVE